MFFLNIGDIKLPCRKSEKYETYLLVELLARNFVTFLNCLLLFTVLEKFVSPALPSALL